jgi:hypothetical protein
VLGILWRPGTGPVSESSGAGGVGGVPVFLREIDGFGEVFLFFSDFSLNPISRIPGESWRCFSLLFEWLTIFPCVDMVLEYRGSWKLAFSSVEEDWPNGPRDSIA